MPCRPDCDKAAMVSSTVRVPARNMLGEPGQARGSRFAPTGPDEWVGLDGYYTGEPLRVVRATDGTGATQPEERTDVAPDVETSENVWPLPRSVEDLNSVVPSDMLAA